jgi:hypothetical protein
MTILRTALLCIVVAVISGCAPGRGEPVLGSAAKAPEISGTISGIVRGAPGDVPLSGRRVTAINLSSGAKFEATTATNGGYTMKVPAGRYRVEVELMDAEVVAEAPGEVTISSSDLDSGRDFSIRIKP